jgi:hypothetical protein
MPIKVKLPYKWPLAIDIVRKGFDRGLGPNIEQTLLGGTGFVTIDPENIETMLSTRFEGKPILIDQAVNSINGLW